MAPLDRQPWPRACVHVCTGDGKGRTTAPWVSHSARQGGSPTCLPWSEAPPPEEVALARRGLARAREVLAEGLLARDGIER